MIGYFICPKVQVEIKLDKTFFPRQFIPFIGCLRKIYELICVVFLVFKLKRINAHQTQEMSKIDIHAHIHDTFA